jgi:hypothetical protein
MPTAKHPRPNNPAKASAEGGGACKHLAVMTCKILRIFGYQNIRAGCIMARRRQRKPGQCEMRRDLAKADWQAACPLSGVGEAFDDLVADGGKAIRITCLGLSDIALDWMLRSAIAISERAEI